MLFLLPLTLATPLAECPKRYDAATVMEAEGIAENDYQQLQTDGMVQYTQTTLDRLACVTEPMSAPQIARIHMMVAIVASYQEDGGSALAALSAALATAPGFDYSQLLPEKHPLRADLLDAGDLARDSTSRPLRMDKKEQWWIEVDGKKAPVVPTQRNAVLQLLDNQGRVLETRYWRPHDDLGSWDPASKVKMPPPLPVDAVSAQGEGAPDGFPSDDGGVAGGGEANVVVPERRISTAFRAWLGPSLLSLGLPGGSRTLAFGGSAAVGLARPLSGLFGLQADIGYAGDIGGPADPALDLGTSSHLVFLQGGISVGSATFRLEAGPSAGWEFARAGAVFPSGLGASGHGVAKAGGMVGGGYLGLDYHFSEPLSVRMNGRLQWAGAPWFDTTLALQWGG